MLPCCKKHRTDRSVETTIHVLHLYKWQEDETEEKRGTEVVESYIVDFYVKARAYFLLSQTIDSRTALLRVILSDYTH